MGLTCHSLNLFSPCAAQFAVWRSTSPEAVRGRRGASPRARPSVTPPSRPRRLPELATCLTPIYASLSSPSPPCVRHERLLKLFAFAGPIREFPSMDPKSTSPEACLPS